VCWLVVPARGSVGVDGGEGAACAWPLVGVKVQSCFQGDAALRHLARAKAQAACAAIINQSCNVVRGGPRVVPE
jgi:hypothetical protein